MHRSFREGKILPALYIKDIQNMFTDMLVFSKGQHEFSGLDSARFLFCFFVLLLFFMVNLKLGARHFQ